MKKLVIIAGIIATITTTIASATLIVTNEKQHELERAARLQNLSVVAVKNGDFALACKAQLEVTDALVRAHVKGQDLIGSVTASKQAVCAKAIVASK